MDTLTISSSMLIPSAANVEITPAMLGVLWRISHELDAQRIPENYPDAKWLEIPSASLRNPNGKTDNQWLRHCLEKLTSVKLAGEYRGDPWGAVILAQWEIIDGGRVTRLLIPPAAIAAVRAPKTFAKIEITAAYKLKGHARRLYAALADKKRMGQPHWEYSIPELRQLFDVGDKYPKWADFHRYVLKPAIAEINDYGTVVVQFSTKRLGRSINSIRFDWEWKTVDAARVTGEENQRLAMARHKNSDGTAPPLTLTAAQKHIHGLLNDHTKYVAWFGKCEFVENGNGLDILAPSSFVADFIKEHYAAELSSVQANIFGGGKLVRVLVSKNSEQ